MKEIRQARKKLSSHHVLIDVHIQALRKIVYLQDIIDEQENVITAKNDYIHQQEREIDRLCGMKAVEL